jgi:hypothetical protein
MLTDTVLKHKGYDVLFDTLGLVDAERFISLLSRESFDYTKWRNDFYKENLPMDEFVKKIKELKKKKATKGGCTLMLA